MLSIILATWITTTWLVPPASLPPNDEPPASEPLSKSSPTRETPSREGQPLETLSAEPAKPVRVAPDAPPASDARRFDSARQLAIERIRNGKTDEADAALESLQNLAQDPSAKECVAGLVALKHYLSEFEKGYLQGRNRLEGGTELVVAGKRIICRGRESDRLLFRSEGKNLTFAEASVPWPLRLAIADLWLDPQDPATALAKSAFFSIGPARSAERAEESWQAAERLGGGDQVPALRRAFAELE